MRFFHVEWQTPANDPTLLESLHREMYYETESKLEASQMAKHYKASNAKCDPTTVVVKELSEEEVKNLRAEKAVFHKIDKF
jgi:hypothetical protein